MKILKNGERFTGKDRDGKDYDWGIEDIPLDYDGIAAAGSMSGSGGMMVLDDSIEIPVALANLMAFYSHESCGQCTPCRVGTEKAVKLMRAPVWDQALLGELGQAMADASICGLGQAASNPLRCVMQHFPEEIG